MSSEKTDKRCNKLLKSVTDAYYSVKLFFLTCNSAYVSVIAFLKHVMRKFI